MWTNEGTTDRIVRVVIGIGLLYLGWSGTVTGTAGTVLKWIGFVPLLTGLVGFCALYRVLGINTAKRSA